MAKFYGRVGFELEDVEVRPGDFESGIYERKYYGDVTRNTRRYENAQQINDNLAMNVQLSIVADTFAFDHAFAIAYIEYGGVLWKVSTVDIQRPRLIISLGGVYNGKSNAAP